MKNLWLLALLAIPSFTPVFAQITINSTTPCFYNFTAGSDMWRQCGVSTDFLQTVTMPWEWVSGGYFSMILVSVLCTFSYIKYHKAVYPMLIGILFLPIAWFIFPTEFLNFGIVMMIIGLGILIWYVFIRQTKEYAG